MPILEINITFIAGFVTPIIIIGVVFVVLLARTRKENSQFGVRLKKLSDENERLRQLSLAGTETCVMLIFDQNKDLKYVNEQFKHLYHTDEQSYINTVGRTMADYLKWSGYTESFSIDSRRTFIGKAENTKGRSIWKQITITPNTDERGNTNYMVVEVDITSVKETELQLQAQKKRSDELLLNMLVKTKTNKEFIEQINLQVKVMQDKGYM